jgi:hypothetical protein
MKLLMAAEIVAHKCKSSWIYETTQESGPEARMTN